MRVTSYEKFYVIALLAFAAAAQPAIGQLLPKPSVEWTSDLDKGLEIAKTEKRPVIMDFWAGWCQPCKVMDEMTFSEPVVVKTSKKFVTIRVDADRTPYIVAKYRVSGYPTVLFLNSDGVEVYRRSSVVPPEEFLPIMNDIAAGKNPDEVMAELGKSPPETVPDDAGTLWRLARLNFMQRKEKEALPFMEKLMALPADDVPNRPNVTRLLGLLYARQEMPEKFHSHIAAAVKSTDAEVVDTALELKLAWAREIEKDDEKALAVVHEMLDRTEEPAEIASLNRLIKELTTPDTESGEGEETDETAVTTPG